MFKIIQTSTSGFRTTFGRASPRIIGPGLRVYIPFVQKIILVNNRLSQDKFKIKVKTIDDVLPELNIAVQYRINSQNSMKAYYAFNRPHEQMTAYIENLVRAKVPAMTINNLFESQNEICNEVKNILMEKMENHGYTIMDTLITEINLPPEIEKARNHINAAKAMFEAAKYEADAKKVLLVAEAQADKERKRLQGEGISEQRSAILNGYEQSITKLSNSIGIEPNKLIDFIIKIQQFDTMEQIGKQNNTKVLFFPLENNLLRSMVQATESVNM